MVSRRIMATGAAVAASALLLAACGNGDSPGGNGNGNGENGADGHLGELQDAGSVTVGFAGEEPYSYEEDGEITGAVIAIAQEVFGELGVDEVDGQLTDWGALIPGLNAERFDVISAGMSILPDRCAQADFGDPEIMYTTALLVPDGNPNNLQNLQDVEEAGVGLAVMSGAIEQGYAEDMDLDHMTVSTPQDGWEAVTAGRADAFALTAISLRSMHERTPDDGVEVTEAFEAVVDGVVQVGAGATVFRPGDDELREAWNEELASIIGDPDEFERVLGPFGFTEAERPTEDITTEMLCEGDLPEAED